MATHTPDEKLLLKRAIDKARQADRNCYPTATRFMAPEEAAFVAAAPELYGYPFITDGGYPDAERRIFLFLPSYMPVDTLPEQVFPQEDQPLSFLRIENTAGAPLTHRDYLGALMALGISRDMTGDILIEDGSATLICLREILPFLLQNFTKAGACTLRLEEIQRAGFVPPQPQGKELTGTVAALRLDALAALAFRLSREEIKRCIAHGTLSCNHRQAEKGDVLLQPGDLLSLRGHGRARLLSVGGESRKGRLFVTFFVYL